LKISVYLSSSGEQVVNRYGLIGKLRETFGKIWVEHDANTPFLAGQLQTGKFDLLFIAPATSNSIAKISLGIADTLLTNSAIMGLKASIPIFIMPSDYQEGVVITQLPNGRKMKVNVRQEDADNVKKLVKMRHVFVIKTPDQFPQFFSHQLE
jgi:archaeoflavoprotein AfpA